MAKRTVSSSLQLVKKSNALCRACWAPKSVLEPRLVALLASRIHKDDKDFKTYEIHVSEALGERHSGKDYIEIENTVDNIMSRIITIYDANGWSKYNVFSSCRFRRKEGILVLGFHPDLIPHYLQVKHHFAKYRLDEFFALPSTYSQRIYEILRSWDDQQDIEIDLSDLHKMLDVPDSLKKDFAAFRRRVLEKSHKDITKHTSLCYEWEPIKKGRKVVAVRFIFASKRVKKAAVKKDMKQKQQAQRRNNKNGRAAIKCYEAQKGVCNEDQPKDVCKACRTMFSIKPQKKYSSSKVTTPHQDRTPVVSLSQ